MSTLGELLTLLPFPPLEFSSNCPNELRTQRMRYAAEDVVRLHSFAKTHLAQGLFEDFFASLQTLAVEELEDQALLQRAQQKAHLCYRALLSALPTQNSLGTPNDARLPQISILAPTCRPHHLQRLLQQFFAQDYPVLELLLLLHHPAFKLDQVQRAIEEAEANQDKQSAKTVQIHFVPTEYTLGESLNLGRECISGQYCAKIDDDNFYGARYFSDLLLPFRLLKVDVVGKCSFYSYLESSDSSVIRFEAAQHRDAALLQGGAFLARAEVFKEIAFSPIQQGSDTDWMKRCRAAGFRLYATDPYNFISLRRADPQQHTWRISEEEYLRAARTIAPGLLRAQVMI